VGIGQYIGWDRVGFNDGTGEEEREREDIIK